MPPDAPHPFAAIILAAQRAGEADQLAVEAELTHKCMVPIGGLPLIAYPACALQSTPGLTELRIVVEPDMESALRAVLPGGSAPVAIVPAADNLADSVLAGSTDLRGPVIVTTADNVLLTSGAIGQVLSALARGADVAVAMARRDDVLAAHPEGQRRFYRFRDDHYSNCNLYGFADPRALAAAETFRGGGQFAKKPRRLVAAVGIVNVLLMLAGRLTLARALARVGRRFGLAAVPVVLADGAHAIDVDNRRTFDVASSLLAQRE